MKVYSIKRYKITDKLRTAIKKHPYSMRKLGRELGFEVKNIFHKNISINEEHWHKLNSILKLDLQLEEIKFNFTKNLYVEMLCENEGHHTCGRFRHSFISDCTGGQEVAYRLGCRARYLLSK